MGNSVKSDVHFGHFEGLDFYCQWGQLGFKVCMMCMGTTYYHHTYYQSDTLFHFGKMCKKYHGVGRARTK